MYHDLGYPQQNKRMCLPIPDLIASCSLWHTHLVLSYTEDEATPPPQRSTSLRTASSSASWLPPLVMQRNKVPARVRMCSINACLVPDSSKVEYFYSYKDSLTSIFRRLLEVVSLTGPAHYTGRLPLSSKHYPA